MISLLARGLGEGAGSETVVVTFMPLIRMVVVVPVVVALVKAVAIAVVTVASVVVVTVVLVVLAVISVVVTIAIANSSWTLVLISSSNLFAIAWRSSGELNFCSNLEACSLSFVFTEKSTLSFAVDNRLESID